MKAEETQKRMTFSLIIPMKNADRYIRNALNSIAEQEFDDIQVIVVDDNSDSTDISQYLVNEWKRQHPNINLQLLKTSKGQGGPGGDCGAVLSSRLQQSGYHPLLPRAHRPDLYQKPLRL